MIQPGLINVASLLGMRSWRGLPNRYETLSQLAVDPTSAADVIVSIIYKYSSKALKDFFAASGFRFVHFYDKIDPRQAPEDFERFAITRNGSRFTVSIPHG